MWITTGLCRDIYQRLGISRCPYVDTDLGQDFEADGAYPKDQPTDTIHHKVWQLTTNMNM
jgi:hypothetical protein